MRCPNCRVENHDRAKFCGECGVSLAELSAPSFSAEENPVLRISNVVYPAFAMLAGMQLDSFTPLKDGPMTAEQLAAAIDVAATKLKPLLYALVTAGLLTVQENLFANTDIADRFLVRNSPCCMLGAEEHYSDLWQALLKTAESIRTGLPQAKHDYSAMSSDQLERCIRGMHPEALGYGRDLAARFDLSSCRSLLDVGGGSGGLAMGVTEALPHIRATVVDLPTVTPITKRLVEEAGVGNRIQVVAADVVRDPLAGSYDVAVLSALLQVLSTDDARRSLKNIGRAVNQGGSIYIRGLGIIDNSRTSPPDLVGYNLVFINYYDEGQAYTEQEHMDWLTEAGFEGFERITLPEGGSWITARKSK
jgi:SAM-dependent methyltransferase